MSKSNKTAPTSTLRIIGGQHRGRKLPIPNLIGLRPTSDRIRETLFNWLQFELPGMTVLDLFAGTGALGFEAISREAAHATLVEPQVQAARAITQSLASLNVSNAEVKMMTAAQFLSSIPRPFDLVFVDPPFDLDLWGQVLTTLVDAGWVTSGSLIYLECPNKQVIDIPPQLQTVKDKTGGKVRFRLLKML